MSLVRYAAEGGTREAEAHHLFLWLAECWVAECWIALERTWCDVGLKEHTFWLLLCPSAGDCTAADSPHVPPGVGVV